MGWFTSRGSKTTEAEPAPAPGDGGWERDLIARLATAALAEQRRARRWGIFFKLLFFVYLTFLLAALIDWQGLGSSKAHTAMVDLTGIIAPGNDASAEKINASLQAAFKDRNTKGVILRINSPGGSALASELISREVFATKGIKPILCSMSDVAASGGYFSAAGCDEIFAEPMTITGSIGIFYGKFDVAGLLRKLGVTTDTDKRGKHADAESLYRPLTDEERAKLLDMLRYSYSRFVGAVAEGRHLSKTDVDAAGRGHVYTGEQAKAVKLIDVYGGLGDAIDEAKKRMGLAAGTKIQLYELPEPPKSLLGTAGKLLGLHASDEDSLLGLPLTKQLLRGIPGSVLVAPEGAQARLPYDITFE